VDDRSELAQSGASLAAEAGGRDLKRAVVLPGFEGNDLAVRRSAVFGFELPVDEAVGGTKVMVATRLRSGCELDLGAIAEVVGGEAEALAREVFLLAVGDGAEAQFEGLEFAVA
jgi:hypothetical protein